MIDPKNLAGTATLTFADEFNSFKIWDGSTGWDTKWYYNPAQGGMGYNNELQWYINEGYGPTDAVNPWTASGGILDITAHKTPASIASSVGNAKYVSGMINSYHDFSQQYGYFEMRAELPAGQGLWPAFWLLRQDGKMSSEIDIMEQLGQQPSIWYSSVHSFASGSIKSVSGTHTGTDTSAGMHTYGLNWTAQKLEFYQDGVKYWETATPSDMHVPMYMIANLAVGGNWPGSPNSSMPFPAEMQIDYIRVYKDGASTTPTTPTTPTPTDPVPVAGRTITGTNRSEALTGGADDDTINGGAGNDIITGGDGNDRLRGGSGVDRFVFDGHDGRDIILDFQSVDVIRFLKVAGLNSLRDVLNNTVDTRAGADIHIPGTDDHIIVAGVSERAFVANEFLFT